jgi:hypothetical protein
MRLFPRYVTAVAAMLVATFAVVAGPGAPAWAGGGVIRDDDGTMEASVYYTSDYDIASKSLVIPTGFLEGAQSATLSVYGKADSNCGTDPEAQRLEVNSSIVARFNPCTKWSTAAFSWATFSVDPGLLWDYQWNGFRIWDSGDAVNGNTYFGIDTDHGYNRSAYSHYGWPSPAGELMWYLTVVAPPQPGITVTPTSIDFGSVDRGSSSAPHTVTVTSSGAAVLDVSGVTVDYNESQYAKSADTCSGTSLAPGLSCTFQVTYSPTYWSSSQVTGNVTIATNAGNRTVALTGFNASPDYAVSPRSYDFGAAGVGSTTPPVTVRVSSTGSAPLTVSTVLVGGSYATDYQTSSDTCTGATLAPGAWCTFRVQFTPTGSGWRPGYAAISTNNGTFNFFLDGMGDAFAPTSTFTTPNASVVLTSGAVSGSSTDDASAIVAVWVTYAPVTSLLTASTVGATRSNCTARYCDWSAPAPLVPGVYLVTARATDAYGRAETPGPTITVVVA